MFSLLAEQTLTAAAVVQLLNRVRHGTPANPLVTILAKEIHAGKHERLGVGCGPAYTTCQEVR